MSRGKKRMFGFLGIVTVLAIVGIVLFKSYERKIINVAHEYLSNEYPYEMEFVRVNYNWIVDPACHKVFFSSVENPEFILYVRVTHGLKIANSNAITEFKGKLN